MKTQGMRRMAGRVIASVRDINDAHRRLMALQMSMDRYLANPDAPPDTYPEFLMRTSGPLLHEPPASKRAAR